MQHSICIPGVPPVDVSELYRIIDTEAFQALRERKQLGVNSLVFPGAVHTRFEHSIGVLSLAQRLCRIHGITGNDARHIQAFALLHDIGHGPFSHQTEPVLQGSHHKQGLKIIAKMAYILESLGIDPLRICNMLQGDDPMAAWISDRNLGADKLDYLSRDALHIGFFGTPDIERIQYYTVMTDDGLAIEDKFVEDAKQLQKYYTYLHQHGYLNKTALAAQRMLQRAVQQELETQNNAGDALWDMTDNQLEAWLDNVRHPVAKKLAEDLSNRRLHKTFLALKPAGYAYVERQADKPLTVHEWPRANLRDFSDFAQSPKNLIALEDEIAASCGCKPGDVLFAAMPYFKKLIPKDLRVFSCSRRQQDFWLLENDKDHRKSLESDYLRTFAIRLVAPPELREKLSQKSDRIEKIILDAINNNQPTTTKDAP